MNETKTVRLFQAVTELDEKLIEEAQDSKAVNRKRRWLPLSAAAACLCLLLAGLWHWRTQKTPGGPSPDDYIILEEDGSVTIPPAQVDFSSDGAACMIAFFIYQGRCYRQYEWHIAGSPGLIGTYLGTATDLIDEWTSRDGYVELAGSIGGDFYSVTGYDPSFMLCMKENDGSLSTYICDNGITLRYGRELYEERLHVKESYETVQYESRSSWFYGQEDIHTLPDPQSDTVSAFLDALSQAEFLPDKAICFQEGDTRLYDASADCELWHLYFRIKDGTSVGLRLHEGGYVRFEGILDVCVRIPENVFEELCGLLAEHSEG